MPLIKCFEEIRAWQEARVLNREIYALAAAGGLAHDFGLRDQLQRASVSVMANIAEGFDCDSKAEFARFLGSPGARRWKSNPCSTPRSMWGTSPGTPFKPITTRQPGQKPSSAP